MVLEAEIIIIKEKNQDKVIHKKTIELVALNEKIEIPLVFAFTEIGKRIYNYKPRFFFLSTLTRLQKKRLRKL